MTGKDLLQAMNELEDEMVETSLQNNFQTNQTELISMKQNRKSKIRKTVLKWSVAAVAALCCLGGGVAYAAKHGISLNWKYRYKTTTPKIAYITEDELSKNIQAVKQEMSDVTLTNPQNNTQRTVPAWYQSFDTVKEAVDFIDCNSLKLPDFPGTLENTFVQVLGNEEAAITHVIAQANYTYENVCASIQANLYVDVDSDFDKTLTKYSSTIVNDTYTTKNGKKVCIKLPLKYDFYEDYYDGVLATLIDGNVIYSINVYNANSMEQDTDYLIQLIKDWFDQF